MKPTNYNQQIKPNKGTGQEEDKLQFINYNQLYLRVVLVRETYLAFPGHKKVKETPTTGAKKHWCNEEMLSSMRKEVPTKTRS